MLQSDQSTSRVLMIGWDGATFDLIRPWVARGELPTLARLLGAGAHGPLRSTLPPWTFPAWTSFMTGKNPGKHGIYDFFRPRPGSYDLEFVNGRHRRAKTFWRLLSEAGRQVVSISVPCTFPPEPVNGVMLSGFDFPGEGPGSFVDARGMYPPGLYEELARNVGRHPIDAAVIQDVNQGRLDLALESILHTIRRKALTARYLMLNKPWDCFMILFGESDGAGHQFWRYCDPNSPLFAANRPAHNALLRVYQELDRQTGELLDLAPPGTTFMMMSDHGFGGVGDWALYPNNWLAGRGLLAQGGSVGRGMSKLRDAVKRRAVAALPAWLQRCIYRLGGKAIGRFEARVRYGTIDWARTQAYFDENPYFPPLRVNLKGRQPNGTVEPGRAYEALRDRLIRDLEDWRHPATGARIVERAFRREEVYSGPYVEEAPDVVVKWALHQGYSYAFKLSARAATRDWIERIDPSHPDSQSFFSSKSGTHRDDGIFLAHGPLVRRGLNLSGAQIVDLAPTILHLLGVAVPGDMDGRVLDELFTVTPALAQATESAAPAAWAPPAEEGTYSAEDEATIAERLKCLGYVE